MTDNAALQPVKPRLTRTGIDRWREQAAYMFATGQKRPAVEAWLKSQGCPPRTRAELLRKAHAKGRGHHRRAGLRALSIGLVMWAIGALCLWVAYAGIPAGGGVRVHASGLLLFGGAFLLAGATPILFGVWKFLTGSAMAGPAER